jgi:hypothetical protein
MKNLVTIFLAFFFLSSCAVKLTDNKKNEFVKQLKKMAEIDQVALKRQGKDLSTNQWHQYQDSVLTNNKIKVEAMFDEYGFLGFDKVGKEGSKHFWLIVQHCDKYPQFQGRVLKAMKREVRRGNANANDYAYLYDRVEVNAGKKQMFGTQVNYDTAGLPFPRIGLIDSANVDKLRKAYNLEPLKDYYDFIINYRSQKN